MATDRHDCGERSRCPPRSPRAFAKSTDILVLANAHHVCRLTILFSRIDRRGRRGLLPITATGLPTAGGREYDRHGPADDRL